jgi:hypothetical protein
MPLSFPTTGNAEEFVGQVFNLRPISIGLPTSLLKPPRRVDNPPQVANLPHIRRFAGLNMCWCPVSGELAGIAHECVRHKNP